MKMPPSLKNRKIYPSKKIPIRQMTGFRFLITCASLLVSGCATLPPHFVKVAPPPIRTFPPIQPGFVCLPVVISFPPGRDVVQQVTNLFKGGIKQLGENIILKSKMKFLWDVMAEPIRLDKDLWLLVHPESMSLGYRQVKLNGAKTTQPVLQMSASPELVFGSKPAIQSRTMPPLVPFRPEPTFFEAITNIHMNYEDANRYLADPRLKVKNTLISNTGNRKLTIEGIRLYGSGGDVIVEVKLNYNPLILNLSSQPAHLTLYLRGTPRYVPGEAVFDLPDLEYDVKTSDLMVQVADWLFKSDFKNQLRRIVKFPAGENMSLLQMKINRSLNRRFSRSLLLVTEVDSFKVLDGYADNTGIEARLSIKGSSTLEVIWN
jgi:hypothetical protein